MGYWESLNFLAVWRAYQSNETKHWPREILIKIHCCQSNFSLCEDDTSLVQMRTCHLLLLENLFAVVLIWFKPLSQVTWYSKLNYSQHWENLIRICFHQSTRVWILHLYHLNELLLFLIVIFYDLLHLWRDGWLVNWENAKDLPIDTDREHQILYG